MITRPVAGVIALLLVAHLPLGAQVESSLDLGAGSGRFDGSTATGVMSLAPSLRIAAGRFHLAGTAVYSDYRSGGWQGYGSLSITWTTPSIGRFRAQFAGTGEASVHHRTASAGLWEAAALVVAGGDGWGGWIGASRAIAYVSGNRGEPFLAATAGTWNTFGPFRFQVAMKHALFADSVLRPDVLYSPEDPRQDTLFTTKVRRYSDLAAEGEWTKGPLSLNMGIGRRVGPAPFELTSWHMRGSYQLTPTLAVMAATGRFPSDVPIGLLGGRYTTLSFRVSLLGAGTPPLSLVDRTPEDLSAFKVQRIRGQLALIKLRGEGVRRTEIMGDFTDWQEIDLQPTGSGWWQGEFMVTPGPHRFNVRYDGGPWQVPPGTTPVADDFGGMAGQFTMQ